LPREAQKKQEAAPSIYSGYRKGEETRQRILDAALKAFGEAPFKGVTTRQISEAACVSLPTLQYYFGDKEGLYQACAESLISRYRTHTAIAATKAREALNNNCSQASARTHLKSVIAALAEFMIGSSEAQRWAQFVARESRDAGPAFELLYEKLWRPGVEIVARLIARIRGQLEIDPESRVQALLLMGSLLAFQPGRTISMRALRWSSIGAKELALVQASLSAQIDAIDERKSRA
jgi:AcrR family transcriptional regulator